MESPGPISVIIPTLNEELFLPALLQSLHETGIPMEVIVVDGNSTDATIESAELFAPRFSGDSSLRVMRAPRRGVAFQRNLGARAATHDTLVFLDADVLITKEALRTLVRSFNSGGYDVAAPKLTTIELDRIANLIFLSGLMFEHVMLLFGRAYFFGVCIITKRDVFTAVGGFDEHFRITEDIDYSLRASKARRAAILPVWVDVSNRRFAKYGHLRVYFQWMRMLLYYHLSDRGSFGKLIRYPFGEFTG